MDKMVLFKYGREIEFKRNHLTDINRVQWCNFFCLFGSVTRSSEHESKQKKLQPVHFVPIKLDLAAH